MRFFQTYPVKATIPQLSTLMSLALLISVNFLPGDGYAKSLTNHGAGSAKSTQPNLEGMPAGLILDDLKTPFIFWVSLETSQLYLLERTRSGHYIQRHEVPISIGKQGFGKSTEGDQKTPVGVYQITSFLTDDQLDNKYGIGAYPLNYPNRWDQLLDRTGSGIWLHGLPKGVASRPTLDSDGCIVIDNEVLKSYAQFVDPGASLFVLSNKLNWLPMDGNQPDKDILEAINTWKSDWTSKDNDRYLANYDQSFTDSKRNLAQWIKYKTRVNNSKRYIKVELSDMTVVAYPGEDNLVVSRFFQSYESNNFKWHGWKQLFWRRDDSGKWRIIFEGNG